MKYLQMKQNYKIFYMYKDYNYFPKIQGFKVISNPVYYDADRWYALDTFITEGDITET